MSVIPIETDRLVIRNFAPADGDALCEMILQLQASDLAKYDQPWPTDPEAIRGVAAWFAEGDQFLAVCLKDGGRFIGFVALNGEGEGPGRRLNLGYIFNFDYHGQGYATEACEAALDWAFSEQQVATMVSGTADANVASCRLLARLGFRQVSSNEEELQKDANGRPIGFLGHGYELTREEWLAAHP